MYYLFCQLGTGCCNSFGRNIRRTNTAFCISFPPLCYLSQGADGAGGAQDADPASVF